MKIQEMKSGILHLTKRMEGKPREEFLETLVSGEEAHPEPVPDASAPQSLTCELDEPRWAVVSFEQTEAGGLTYRQAALLQAELELNNVTGLCIVTSEAAKRIR